jgi:ABC-2 type transport system ATP-binding protein
MRTVLSIRGLSKRYGGVCAVSGVTLEVNRGEIFGLIGPNGAGKTTTLECVLGLCEPDSGSIVVLGMDARTDPAGVNQKVGALLQSSALPDGMTPRQALKPRFTRARPGRTT